MSQVTGIEWTDATWNPWHGCHKVSQGCKFCYMFRDKKRYGQNPDVVQRSKTLLNAPLKWEKKPTMCFTCSWSDWLIEEADPWREEAYEIIRATPWITYQILTKRIERATGRLPNPPLPNVWLGVSVENQETADARIPLLLKTPAARRFVSYEPALGPVSFERWTETGLECGNCNKWAGCESGAVEAGPEDDTGFACPECGEMCMHTPLDELLGAERGINWVIAGGESGPESRAPQPAWFQTTRDQCVAAGVPFFFKQWGEWLPGMQDGALIAGHQIINSSDQPQRVGKKKAGALLDGCEWKQFPEVVVAR